MRFRFGLLVLAVLACFSLGWATEPRLEEKTVNLFDGKNLDHWRKWSNTKDAKLDELFSVKDGVLKVANKPSGYIITKEEYSDYVLTLEWRWPEAAGNSGVLLHCQGEDKVWPKSAEAQLYREAAGDIWLIDNFKLTVDKERQDPKQARHYLRMVKEGVEKKTGEWNKYVITCKGKTIKLEVNGKMMNEGKDAEFSKGKIALQAEGAAVEFRNIALKKLD